MATDEFKLISRYFAANAGDRADVILGIGDDCAFLKMQENQQLAVSMDNLVENVHFFAAAPPYYIGYKALAVSLSDMAAVGAEPAWVTAALTLTNAAAHGEKWIDEFCRGFFAQFACYDLQLVGGNTTRGSEINIATQLHGFLPQQQGLRRSGARVGDIICVTGSLGDAGMALQLVQKKLLAAVPSQITEDLWERLYCPPSRIDMGRALLSLASAAIDISDGLLADLGHILEQSGGVGATLEIDKLPLSPWLLECSGTDIASAQRLALGAGDDYELCFTVPTHLAEQVEILAREYKCSVTQIGVIDATPGLRIKQKNGALFAPTQQGYLHKW